MKNILLKISISLIALFIFVGSNVFVKAQGLMDYGYSGDGFSLHNIINHYTYGAGALFIILFLIGVVFWIWMLIHAIKHKIELKPVWILVLWFMNIIGAIIYYFAVKRNCDCDNCQSPNSKNTTEKIVWKEDKTYEN